MLRDILMYQQIFFSPQVKRRVIISNTRDIYEFPHQLMNDLRRRSLSNKKITEKV